MPRDNAGHGEPFFPGFIAPRKVLIRGGASETEPREWLDKRNRNRAPEAPGKISQFEAKKEGENQKNPAVPNRGGDPINPGKISPNSKGGALIAPRIWPEAIFGGNNPEEKMGGRFSQEPKNFAGLAATKGRDQPRPPGGKNPQGGF